MSGNLNPLAPGDTEMQARLREEKRNAEDARAAVLVRLWAGEPLPDLIRSLPSGHPARKVPLVQAVEATGRGHAASRRLVDRYRVLMAPAGDRPLVVPSGRGLNLGWVCASPLRVEVLREVLAEPSGAPWPGFPWTASPDPFAQMDEEW